MSEATARRRSTEFLAGQAIAIACLLVSILAAGGLMARPAHAARPGHIVARPTDRSGERMVYGPGARRPLLIARRTFPGFAAILEPPAGQATPGPITAIALGDVEPAEVQATYDAARGEYLLLWRSRAGGPSNTKAAWVSARTGAVVSVEFQGPEIGYQGAPVCEPSGACLVPIGNTIYELRNGVDGLRVVATLLDAESVGDIACLPTGCLMTTTRNRPTGSVEVGVRTLDPTSGQIGGWRHVGEERSLQDGPPRLAADALAKRFLVAWTASSVLRLELRSVTGARQRALATRAPADALVDVTEFTRGRWVVVTKASLNNHATSGDETAAFGTVVTGRGLVGTPQVLALLVDDELSEPAVLEPDGALSLIAGQDKLARFGPQALRGDGIPPRVQVRVTQAQRILRTGTVRFTLTCNEPCQGIINAQFGDRGSKRVFDVALRVRRGVGFRRLRMRLSPAALAELKRKVIPLYLAQVSAIARLRDSRGNTAHIKATAPLTTRPACDQLAGVIAQSDMARLAAVVDYYELRFIACRRGTSALQMVKAIAGDTFIKRTVASGFIVAFVATTSPDGDDEGSVYDVGTGRTLHDLAGRAYTNFNEAIAVSARGDLARIQGHVNPGYQTVELDDAAGHRSVDQGNGIDPTSLRVNGETVMWTHDGETRTAAFSISPSPGPTR